MDILLTLLGFFINTLLLNLMFSNPNTCVNR